MQTKSSAKFYVIESHEPDNKICLNLHAIEKVNLTDVADVISCELPKVNSKFVICRVYTDNNLYNFAISNLKISVDEMTCLLANQLNL